MVCLDTSFLVALVRHDEAALRKLKEVEEEGLKITTTAISACEMFHGAYKSSRVEESVAKTREILKRIQLLGFTPESCERYGKLAYDLRSAGRVIGDLDTLIASLALAYNEPILTSDIKHFRRVPGLIVHTW